MKRTTRLPSTPVRSRYQLVGGFGLLLIFNLLFAIFTYFVISQQIDEGQLTRNGPFGLALTLIGLQLLFLTLFATQCRYLILDDRGITLINPVLPFLYSFYKWTEFDYCLTVDEQSDYATYEAVWLLKAGKLKVRFSSYYYKNYFDLKKRVKITKMVKRQISPFRQLVILLGWKRIKYH